LGGAPSVVFYDMTTLYFESSDEDDLRKTGFSKDGKHQCPQTIHCNIIKHVSKGCRSVNFVFAVLLPIWVNL
jgi:hypothetical protein